MYILKKKSSLHKSGSTLSIFLEKIWLYLDDDERPRSGRDMLLDFAPNHAKINSLVRHPFRFIFKHFGMFLAHLEVSHKGAWALLLSIAVDDPEIYIRLKMLSPFSGTMLVFMEHHVDCIIVKGDFEHFLNGVIKQDTGSHIPPYAICAVSMPWPEREEAIVIEINDEFIEGLRATIES